MDPPLREILELAQERVKDPTGEHEPWRRYRERHLVNQLESTSWIGRDFLAKELRAVYRPIVDSWPRMTSTELINFMVQHMQNHWSSVSHAVSLPNAAISYCDLLDIGVVDGCADKWTVFYERRLQRLAQILTKENGDAFRRGLEHAAIVVQRVFKDYQKHMKIRCDARRSAAVRRIWGMYQIFRAKQLVRHMRLRGCREHYLRFRLHRALLRFMLRRRVICKPIRLIQPTAARHAAATAVQKCVRGRWARKGWGYCFAPPLVNRVLTVPFATEFYNHRMRRLERKWEEKIRIRWEKTTFAQHALDMHLRRVKHAKMQREQRREQARNRFEAQWASYARNLESYIVARHQGLYQESIVDGHIVWMHKQSTKVYTDNPVERKVRINLQRERAKAEKNQFEKHFAALNAMLAIESEEDEAETAWRIAELEHARHVT